MNILDKECKSMAPTFGTKGAAVTKRDKFSWTVPCERGDFMLIDKRDLNIDDSYQREEVSKSKVLEIARNWDWKLFGTLSVIRREDKTFWIYDGGHRCRASFFRDDIEKLPCMIFYADDEKIEAKAFIGANTMKSNVSAFHTHRAAVKTGEPIATQVQSIVEKFGYSIVKNGPKKFAFQAVNTLRMMVNVDSFTAEKAFAACVQIANDGEPISGEVLYAVFSCQKRLEGKASILDGSHLEKMKRETMPGIELAIRREKHIAGKAGEAVLAKAILDILNKGKQRRLSFV